MRTKGRDCEGVKREECTLWSHGSVNMPFKFSGHEFKIRAVNMVVYASPVPLSCMKAGSVSGGSHENLMPGQD